MKIKNIVRWSLLACALPFNLCAQEDVKYPNYNDLPDSIGVQLEAFFERNRDMDPNTLQVDVASEMNVDNKIFISKLPAARKKTVSGKDVYKLSKESSLVVGWVKRGEREGRFLATAVALTEDGICATNFHVLSEMTLSGVMDGPFPKLFLYFVMLPDGKLYPLKKILAADPYNDFAIFQVEMGKDKLSPLPLGEPAVEGEDVYCLSHPKGQLYYFTKGIVSRNHSVLDKKTMQLREEMQITADYAVGSSGGPIIDAKGNLIGLVSSTSAIYPEANFQGEFQMSMKNCVPVKLIRDCFVLKNKNKKK